MFCVMGMRTVTRVQPSAKFDYGVLFMIPYLSPELVQALIGLFSTDLNRRPASLERTDAAIPKRPLHCEEAERRSKDHPDQCSDLEEIRVPCWIHGPSQGN